ncbi:TetR family transcriptional regulator [Nocardia abscessus]|uniref:TetR/AcrR family transcriptional regulator n=1 Tax=Nocardia abscessus TaxID=120957 RepID=UPI001894365C|nr:TetR family transcriptional regulator [Nocardia abscessus]MBF6338515.1 TetR family transcriptional regulator [Nocardia abscessus]
MTQPRRQRTDSARRRAEIAAAALRVLGDHGPRGLTHRAVDAAAQLPPGSVNYHAPTRQRLLEMASDELFAQDMAVAARHFHTPAASTPTLADLAVNFVLEMTGPHARYRVLARHHLLAEARTNPELHRHFETARAAFVQLVRDRYEEAGHPVDATAAEFCVTVIDGLVNRQIFFPDSALPATRIRTVVEAAAHTIETQFD